MHFRLFVVLLMLPSLLVACTPRRRGGGGDDDDSTAGDDDAGDDDAGDDDAAAEPTHRGEAWGNVAAGEIGGACQGLAVLALDPGSGLADGEVGCQGDAVDCTLTFSGARYPEQAAVPATVACVVGGAEFELQLTEGFSVWQDGSMLGGTLEYFDDIQVLLGFGAEPVAP